MEETEFSSEIEVSRFLEEAFESSIGDSTLTKNLITALNKSDFLPAY